MKQYEILIDWYEIVVKDNCVLNTYRPNMWPYMYMYVKNVYVYAKSVSELSDHPEWSDFLLSIFSIYNLGVRRYLEIEWRFETPKVFGLYFSALISLSSFYFFL